MGFEYPAVHQFIPGRPTAKRPAVSRSIQVRVLVGEQILFEIKRFFSFHPFLPTNIPTTGIAKSSSSLRPAELFTPCDQLLNRKVFRLFLRGERTGLLKARRGQWRALPKGIASSLLRASHCPPGLRRAHKGS
jgi:hypothetical protein